MLTRIMETGALTGIAYIRHSLRLSRAKMKSRKKRTRIKGITELSNILTGLELQFHDLLQVTWVFLVDMSGGYSANFAHKGWTDRQVVNVLDGTLTTCLS